MTGYPPPPSSYPPPSPYPPPGFPPASGTPYLPNTGFGPFSSRPTDVMGRRIGAYAIELGIAFVIFIVMFFALASSPTFDTASQATAYCDTLNDTTDLTCAASGTTAYVIDSTEVWAIMLAEGGFGLVNFVLLTGLTGFSLGKLMTGIRVVHQPTGQRCGILRAFLRTILLAVPDLFGAVGVIVAASSTDHRRVGDMAANTLVVNKHAMGQPLSSPAYAPPAVYTPGGYPGGMPTPPGYGYPGQQSPWPAPVATAPPPPWGVPATPPAPPPAPVAPAPSWPDFGTPHDPDATSVFDTASTTDTNPVVDVSPKAKADTGIEAKPEPALVGEGGEPAPGVAAPHWDTKRNTYIQWDPELNAWMQWDYAKNEWQAMK
ncbi:MAG: RDD family protein [Acidimicrobiales bacterium]